MEYRRLGKTGLRVSEIGFGAEWMNGTDAETAAVMDRCSQQGINIFDCWMADPHIRENLGRAMKGHRDEWTIQGHIGSAWQDGQYVRTRDMALVIPSFEEELRLLQTDHFELGMIHYVDKVDEFEDILQGPFYAYVQGRKDAGVIGHIGLSTHNPDVALRAIELGVVEVIMFSINPAFDMMPPSDDLDIMYGDFSEAGVSIDPKRKTLYALAEERGVGLTVMKPYAGGRLLSANDSPFGVALSPAQCIHYCLTRPSVSSVLCGYKTPEEVDAAVAYETTSDIQRDFTHVLAEAPKHAYFGQCVYCGHCQPCIAGIDIAMVNKLADLAMMQDEVPESIRQHYYSLDANASDCVVCRKCESRCPFGVLISARMGSTRLLFED